MSTGPESLEAAEARLERIAPGYLAEVRERAAAIGLPKTPEERVRRMTALVSELAVINADAPTGSARRASAVVKRGVGTLVRFYFLHVTGQVATLGESTAQMGDALCDYVAGLEKELVELRERVARLEAGTPDSYPVEQ